jgi:putative spermidine/putrescine transport system permease protein
MSTAEPAISPPLPAASGQTRRSRLAERGIDRTLLLLAPAVILLVALFAYPFLYGLQLSLRPQEGGGIFANYRNFFSDAYERGTIATTLKLALPATAINVLASIPIAYRMRGAFRGKRLLTAILVVPVTLGTVLVAEGLLRYLGPRGWFNRTLMSLGILDEPVRLVHNYWGVLLSLIITGFPFAFLLILSYMSGIDPSLERAAATLGAGPWQRFRRIVLPLLAPGLATTAVLCFVLAFAVFPSASLVGDPSGSTRVLSIAAYHAAFEKYDYSMGSTVAMVMGVVELMVIGLMLGARSRLYKGPSGGGKG